MISHYNNFWGNNFVAYLVIYTMVSAQFLRNVPILDTCKYNYSHTCDILQVSKCLVSKCYFLQSGPVLQGRSGAGANVSV